MKSKTIRKFKRRFKTAVIDENPTFVSFLALCPTLGTTTSFSNAFGMGVSVVIVLIMSNVAISLVRKVIPSNIRIPVYITIIATLVTVLEMVLNTFLPDLYATLGIFLPLIVVNCIILGRAEAYASRNNVSDSAMDGLVMGLSFALSLSTLGILRELIGSGRVAFFNFNVLTPDLTIGMFSQGPGAFLMLAMLAWAFNEFKAKYDKKKKAKRRT